MRPYRNRVVERALALGLLSQAACGGQAQRSDSTQAEPDGVRGGAAASGGTSAQSAGNSGEGGSTQTGSSVAFDDAFPWFDGSGASQFPSGPSDQILHIVLTQSPARGTLSTHNLYDALRGVSAVKFSARASAPFRMLVSASDSIQAYDYFAARSAGMPWPVAGVEVGLEWQKFSVPLADMQPENDSDDGIPSFFLAFIVEHPVPIEVWLNDVRFD